MYFTIKEASKFLEVTYAHLHHLEKEIPGLKIQRTKSGRRLYHTTQLSQLKQIIYLTKKEGISIRTAGSWVLEAEKKQHKILEKLRGFRNTKIFLENLKSRIAQDHLL